MSSSMIKLGLLSLLSTALAVPVLPSGTDAHHPHGTGMAFPAGNDTNAYFPTASGSGRRFRHKTTTTQTLESTTIITEYLTVSPKPVSAAADSVSTPCTSSTVSITTTNIVTVTVQPQQSAAATVVSSAAIEESSVPAPAVSSAVVKSPSVVATSAAVSSAAASPVAVSSAAYEAPAVVSSAVASSVVSSAAAPSASSSDEDAVDASAYQGQKQVSSTTTVSTSSVGSNKRGVAYNDKSYTTCFEGKSKLSWAYNWGQVSDGLSSTFKYTPMLWGTRSDFLANWEGNAKTAITNGATEILGFNEPDLAAQANMSPAEAAAAYKTHITDKFAGAVRLGSPAVTNGAAESGMGLGWLTSFLSACSNCQIDFVAIHWYDSGNNVEYFKQHITDAHTQTGKPVWLTEFGATDGDVNAFLKEVLPWLDQQSFVERYSYFMAKDGILNSGTGLSTVGSTYATT